MGTATRSVCAARSVAVCTTGAVLASAAVGLHLAGEQTWGFVMVVALVALLAFVELGGRRAEPVPAESPFSGGASEWSEGVGSDIAREISRCRRHGIPLAVVVGRPVGGFTGKRGQRTQLGRLIQQMCRRTDIVVVDRRVGRFLILAPHAGAAESQRALTRIRAALSNEMGLQVEAGVAHLGWDAVTWEGLVASAESRCSPTSTTQTIDLRPNRQETTPSKAGRNIAS